MSRWVGIDFGTGSCSVGTHRNGAVEVIADEQGTRVTPSCVAFTDQDIVVGEAALSQAHSNLHNTIFDIKHLIQHKFSELSEEALKQWDFKVVAGANDRPAFEVQRKGKTQKYSLEDLIGFVLNKMKETAASYLGEVVENTVITVPSVFNEEQQEIVRKGAQNAGFKQIRLIKDAVAAAMAHSLDVEDSEKPRKTVLVVDFGAGSLDITVLKVDRGLLSILASDSDSSLRGASVDVQLMNHFMQEFEKKQRLKVSGDAGAKALRKLRTAAEKAKRSLTNQPQASLELDGLYEGRDFSTKLSKARFESMVSSIVRKAMAVVLATLQKAGVSKECVDQVLCVGGSSKLTRFQQAMTDNFKNAMKQVSEVSSEEAAVVGAAEQANLFSAKLEEKKDGAPVACPRTVGIAVSGGVVFPMIKRGALLPASFTHKFHSKDTAVLVDVYQGERVQVGDLQNVGKFAVSGMAEGAVVEITLEMDLTGAVRVVAKEQAKGISKELKLEAKGALSEEQLAEEAQKAAANLDADLKLIEELKLAEEDEEDEDDEGDEGDEGDYSESESEDLMLDDDLDD